MAKEGIADRTTLYSPVSRLHNQTPGKTQKGEK
ncbi:unnamed protein product, partial [marine sediment metagenome]